jgi:uncharacterized protein (TIGR02145 family)
MTITNYTIKKSIGQGGMATVYLANDNKFDTNVAIKVLNKEFVHNENIRKRFLAEAKNMFKMSHPNIIKVTDLIDDGDTVAFVMEYIEGQTLKEYIERKGKLSDDEIKTLFSQMLEAVGYVHEQNLVHRDIKPSNFMITPKGQIKLLDFGIAKNTDTQSSDYTQTGTSQNMGTPMYMSPEQIKSTKDVTLQSDIYSLGVVLWQMVMGKKPYDTNTTSTFELQLKIVQDELPSTINFWDSIIQKATAKDVGKRYNNCTELRQILANSTNKRGNIEEDTIISNNNDKTVLVDNIKVNKTPTVKKKKNATINTEYSQKALVNDTKKPSNYWYFLLILVPILIGTIYLSSDNDNPSVDNSLNADINQNFELNLTDQNGNTFDTVQIGVQTWSSKNLNVDKFRNGDPIQQVKSDNEWVSAAKKQKPAWCYFKNDPANGDKYGKLYNWYAVNDARGLAPQGWHVPDQYEWNQFVNYLGGFPINIKNIKKLKKWDGLLAGVRCDGIGWNDCKGSFMYGVGSHGGWWASDSDLSSDAIIFDLNFVENTESFYKQSKGFGYAVKIIKD